MGQSFAFEWEIKLIEWIQSWEGTVGTFIASLFTMFGEEMVLIALLGFLYWSYDKKYGKFIGVNVLVSLTLNPVLKNIFVRRRPYMDNPSIKCLKPVEAEADIYDVAAQGYSFPSGHSTNAATVYPSLYLYDKKKLFRICAIVLPVLVGISRVMLGVHYPTDVLAGWALGFICVWCVSLLQRRVTRKTILYPALAAFALPGLFFCRSDDYYTSLGLLIGFMIADVLEEKYVNFENTDSKYRMILRVLGGMAVYLIANTLLKLPFNKEFLYNGSFASHMVRVVRYTIIAVLMLAVYPICFKYTARLGQRKEA